jgi:hypothetical protein
VAFVCVSLAPVLGAEKDKGAGSASPSNQKQFAGAKKTADALVQAAATFDQNVLKEGLGPESDDITSFAWTDYFLRAIVLYYEKATPYPADKHAYVCCRHSAADSVCD